MENRATTGLALVWSVKHLQTILHAERNDLLDLMLEQTRHRGYANQTSSMRSAWEASIEIINECLVSYLSDPNRHDHVDGRHSYNLNPHFKSLHDTALRHRDDGIPLELYNGLLKLFRTVYLDYFNKLLSIKANKGLPKPILLNNPELFIDCMITFFDKAELASLTPWVSNTPKDGVLEDSIRRLTREREQYVATLESLRNPVFIADDNGILVKANRAALHAFVDNSETNTLHYHLALKSQQIQFQNIIDNILSITDRPLNAIWMPTIHGRRCFDIVIRQTKDTVEKLDSWCIILMHDVTEHYLATQRALEAERTMTLFLAAMSHEIRAPLHSVLGAASLVKSAKPEDVESLIDLLDISAQSLSSTLNNVLNFSRFEHQAPQPRPSSIILADAMNNLLRIKKIYAKQQNVPLCLSIASDVPTRVFLDWSMTQQVLGNLLRNALHHDDGRGVEISMYTEASNLIFQINDHGPGLKEEIRTILSSPPATIRPRVTRKNGAGLGLAISQRMIHAMGGTITAPYSTEGTLIKVHLPLEIPIELPATPVENITTDTQLDMECLLVDDDPINSMVTIAMLTKIGLIVDHAYTLDQAQALYQAEPAAYKIFIIDYQLSDGNGSDFARYLRQDPAHQDTPIFLLSANVERIKNSPQDIALFTQILEKPADAGTLARTIRNATQRAKTSSMLKGLSPNTQHKMANMFLQHWSELQSLLQHTDTIEPDKDIAIRAHKLSSGAAIFGLKFITTALKQVEWAHTDQASDPETRDHAHKILTTCTLPPDWFKQESTGAIQ